MTDDELIAELHCLLSDSRLTPWEREFSENIVQRREDVEAKGWTPYPLSDRQTAVIKRMMEQYQ